MWKSSSSGNMKNPSPSSSLGPHSDQEATTSKKVFINGKPVIGVTNLKIEHAAYGPTQVSLDMHIKDVEIRDGSIFLKLNDSTERLSKAELRKLILDNTEDNFEAMKVIEEHKLNREEIKDEKEPKSDD